MWHYVTFHITLFICPLWQANVPVKEILRDILRNKILKNKILLTLPSFDNIKEYQRQLIEMQNLKDNQTILKPELVTSEERKCMSTGKCIKVCFQSQNAK